VFHTYSFRLILDDLYCLGFTPFREISFLPTKGCEFFVTVGRKGQGIGLERIEALKEIETAEAVG
jgi:hypothetical protein